MISPRAGRTGELPRAARPLAAAVVLLAAFLAGPTAHADFAKGKAAFEHGDYALAYSELIEDAQNGNAEAEFMIGEMAAAGLGTLRSYALATEWYRLAAAKGYRPADVTLGLLYLHGAGSEDEPTRITADPAKAATYLKIAADAGDAEAQSLVGQLYMVGNGVPKDPALAKHYTLAAANHGIAAAEYNAGLLILNGAGPAPDLVEAYKWFALAAQALYPGAEQNRRYVMGRMTPERLKQAEALTSAFHATP